MRATEFKHVVVLSSGCHKARVNVVSIEEHFESPNIVPTLEKLEVHCILHNTMLKCTYGSSILASGAASGTIVPVRATTSFTRNLNSERIIWITVSSYDERFYGLGDLFGFTQKIEL